LRRVCILAKTASAARGACDWEQAIKIAECWFNDA
jgi:hypothetical protein